MDNQKMLDILKNDYIELFKIRRTYLAKSKRETLFSTEAIAKLDNERLNLIASVLVEWQVLGSAKEVLYFYDKPWKWVNEINLLYIIFNGQDVDEFASKVEELIRECLDNEIATYEYVKDKLRESLKENAEYITYHKEQINAG